MIDSRGVTVGPRVSQDNHPENRPNLARTASPEPETLERYLARLLGLPVRIRSVAPLPTCASRRESGRGISMRIDYEVGKERRAAVLETMTAGSAERMIESPSVEDGRRSGKSSAVVPRHITSLDTGRIKPGEGLVSATSKEAGSVYRLTAFIEGRAYGEDLVRLKLGGDANTLDQRRADALADHLAEIHGEKNVDPGLYGKVLRTILGQEIIGLLDRYPQPDGVFSSPLLEQLEHRCLKWRWQLKGRTERLSRIHGDFSPWTVLFRDNVDFSVLNRAPGLWGEPAQDVASLTMNYVLSAIQAPEEGRKALLGLFQRFWKRYLEKTGDLGMLEVVPPFLVYQGLTLAGPVGDLGVNAKTRLRLFSFMFQVLEAPRFDPSRVEDLLKEV